MSTDTSLTVKQPHKLIVRDEGPNAYLFDTARFEHMYRIASAMAQGSLIPEHLRGKGPPSEALSQTIGNCLLIVNQSVRWGFDPFAVAPETYVVKGKLGFQGKLVAAVINARAGLKRSLSYEFTGTGDDRTVTVSGELAGEDKPRTITLAVRQAKTENAMWKADPDQKLVYSGATKWARRHCPEIMLGVLTDDDLERIRETLPIDHETAAMPSVVEVLGHAGLTEPKVEPAAAPPVEMPTVSTPPVEPAESVKTKSAKHHKPIPAEEDAIPPEPPQEDA